MHGRSSGAHPGPRDLLGSGDLGLPEAHNSQTPLLLAARRDRAWELEDPVTSSKLEGDMLPVGSVVPNQPGRGPASPH